MSYILTCILLAISSSMAYAVTNINCVNQTTGAMASLNIQTPSTDTFSSLNDAMIDQLLKAGAKCRYAACVGAADSLGVVAHDAQDGPNFTYSASEKDSVDGWNFIMQWDRARGMTLTYEHARENAAGKRPAVYQFTADECYIWGLDNKKHPLPSFSSFSQILNFDLSNETVHKSASDVRVMQNLFILDADMSRIQTSDLEKLVVRGAEGFELPGTVSTMEDCKRIGAYIKAKGLPAGLNVAVDTARDPSSLDPFIRKAGIDYLKSRIDCAVEIGATTLAGPIVLPWGGFYDTDSTVELHEHFLNPKLEVAKISLREVADYARSKGINLALEPLHRHEMHGLNTMVEAAAFVKEVGRLNFGVCLDSSHEVIDGAGPQVYSELVKDLYNRGYFIYAQVSAPSRGDIKNSWIPWFDYLGLLQDIKISSVTIEIMQAKPPFTGRNGAGIRISRLPFEDPFQTVADAIATTREKWSDCAKFLSLKGQH